MHLTSPAVRLLLSLSCAMLSAPALGEDTGVGPPPALAPGQAPPLPQAGPLAEPRSSEQVGFPKALTEYVISPTTLRPARVALGQKLFFEPRLSGDGTVACATCHDPARAFTDGRPASVGIHGRVGQRNAPTILNALYNKHQFWDGRVATLEQQAALPITNPFEMGSASLGDAVSRIADDKDYQTQFMQTFGRAVNEHDMLSAIAEYERTLASFNSPFDHFIAGDANAISNSAKRGWELFNTKARCNLCHALTDNQRDATLFMDNDFHNIGVGILRHHVAPLAQQAERELAQGNLPAVDTAAIASDLSVLGRFLVTRKQEDIASFKTPGLRNVPRDRALLPRWVDANALGCHGPLQQGGWNHQPLARQGHAAVGADGAGDRRHSGVSRLADKPAIQGSRRPGVCTATRSIQSEPPSAGHAAGVRPEAEAATASSALIVR